MLEDINRQIALRKHKRIPLPDDSIEFQQNMRPIRLESHQCSKNSIQLHFMNTPVIEFAIRMLLLFKFKEIEKLFSEELPVIILVVPITYVSSAWTLIKYNS
jgi:hypothetical protein